MATDTATYYWSGTTATSATTAWTDTTATATWTSATSDYHYDTVSSVVYIYTDNWHVAQFEPVDPIQALYQQNQWLINSEWQDIMSKWYRNENHTREMQKKINREWGWHVTEERDRKAREKREMPERRALELLELLIGEKEIAVYKKTGRMFVRGKNGTYFVKKGGGITRVKGKKLIDFCVHIPHKHKCPPTDHAIALKLALEENDKKVIRIANRRMSRSVDELPLAACM